MQHFVNVCVYESLSLCVCYGFRVSLAVSILVLVRHLHSNVVKTIQQPILAV